MLNVGLSELFVFGIIALLVLGPEKLPEAARFAGKFYAKLMYFVKNAQNDIDRELRLSELREQIQQEMQRMTELEQKMQTQLSELQRQTVNHEIKDKYLKSPPNLKLVKAWQYQYLNVDKVDPCAFIPYQLETYLKIKNIPMDSHQVNMPSPVKLKVIV